MLVVLGQLPPPRLGSGALVVVPPWTWWNEPSPRIDTTVVPGATEPLVQVEVGVAGARHRERLVEPADLLQPLA